MNYGFQTVQGSNKAVKEFRTGCKHISIIFTMQMANFILPDMIILMEMSYGKAISLRVEHF